MSSATSPPFESAIAVQRDSRTDRDEREHEAALAPLVARRRMSGRALRESFLDPGHERLDELGLVVASELPPRLDRGLQIFLRDERFLGHESTIRDVATPVKI